MKQRARTHQRESLASRPRARRGSAIFIVLAVLGVMAVLLGAVALAYFFWPFGGDDDFSNVLMHSVGRDTFVNEVIEQGEVESSNNIEVRCEVKSRNTSGTAILEIVAEGTVVQPGDVLVKLDSSALENELVTQKINTKNAEATAVQAYNDFEAAVIAKREYLEGTFAQEQQTIQSEIFVAEENLRRARQYADYSERLAMRGYITNLQLEGDRFAVEKSRNELETARTKLRVLEEYTKAKMLKQFEATIKTAEAKQKSEEGRVELERKNLKLIEDQIAKCTILAPTGGQVIYANHANSWSNSDFVVEPGALVRERQAIIRLPDPGKMQVRAKINESKVALVRPGMKTLVRLDAFGGEILEGVVTRINEYPEPTSRYSSQTKLYAAIITILKPPGYVKAGLTAETRIQVERLENVLEVPVQAVAGDATGRSYVVVQQGESFEPRYIELGSTNDQFVVARSGLSDGEQVVMNPAVLRSRLQLPEAPSVEAKQVAQVKAASEKLATENLAPPGPEGELPTTAVSTDGPPDAAPPAEEEKGEGRKGRRGGGSRGSPASMVQQIFTDLDKNGDGVLSADEIPADRAERLTPADANGDGKIERAELTAAMAKRFSSAGEGAATGGGGQ